MRALILLFLMIGSGFTSSVRVKRNVLQFAQMISCVTDREWYHYNGYGCHCGLGGHGTPLDATDQCCKDHDDCYKNLLRTGACSEEWHLYSVTYLIRCRNINNSRAPNYIQCGWGGSCMKGLCACDKAAVECFQNNAQSFNTNYQNYYKDWCVVTWEV